MRAILASSNLRKRCRAATRKIAREWRHRAYGLRNLRGVTRPAGLNYNRTRDPTTRPIRAVADRLSPRRRRPHGALQLAVRPSSRRRVRPAHRGHRRRALVGRHGRRHSRRPALARPRLGRRARSSAVRTARISSPSGSIASRDGRASSSRDGHAYYCYCTPDELKAQARSGGGKPAAAWKYDRTCCRADRRRDRRARAPRASRAPSAFACRTASIRFDDLVHGPIEFDGATHRRLRHPPLGRPARPITSRSCPTMWR